MPKVCQVPPVWMDSMASVDPKDSLEPQVGVEAAARVLLVFRVSRGSEASPTREVQATTDRRGREETQVVLDAQGSPVCPDLLVPLWGQMFPDLWETPVCLDWMESMVSPVPKVLPALLVPAQPMGTAVTPDSRGSPAAPAGKETRASPEAPASPAAPASKEDEVRPATAEVPVSRVTPVTPVTMETKEPKEYKAVLVVPVARGSQR